MRCNIKDFWKLLEAGAANASHLTTAAQAGSLSDAAIYGATVSEPAPKTAGQSMAAFLRDYGSTFDIPINTQNSH